MQRPKTAQLVLSSLSGPHPHARRQRSALLLRRYNGLNSKHTACPSLRVPLILVGLGVDCAESNISVPPEPVPMEKKHEKTLVSTEHLNLLFHHWLTQNRITTANSQALQVIACSLHIWQGEGERKTQIGLFQVGSLAVLNCLPSAEVLWSWVGFWRIMGV